jgi:hypothetical protein
MPCKTYAVVGSSEAGTSAKTAINVIGSTAIRPGICDVIVGISTTPADVVFSILLNRTTAVGTAGSAFTPAPLDPGDPACVSTAGITHSAEPTYTANISLLSFPQNQRATFRWVAQPGREILGAASANNGVGLKLNAAGASITLAATVHFTE